jgi:hypothetical protein
MANQNVDRLVELERELRLVTFRPLAVSRKRYVARVYWRTLLVCSVVGLFLLPEHMAHLVCLGVCSIEMLRLGWKMI